jgi:hypothetical protein
VLHIGGIRGDGDWTATQFRQDLPKRCARLAGVARSFLPQPGGQKAATKLITEDKVDILVGGTRAP